ncbi:hypothetical protein [Brevibacterium album]|uniref:hypothetical protein n=1 Tax=Brevibacterium album TaxID=417948 RepID=UPI00041D6AD3|nr:hypothetical protein [Brevibacterium album]
MEMTHRAPPVLAWLLLCTALAQAAVPLVPALGPGAMPNESTTPLLITPAGWTFSIWGLIYALTLALAIIVLVRGLRGQASHGPGAREHLGSARSEEMRLQSRLLADLVIACAGAAVWIGFSAAEWNWATSLVLTVMAAVLIDAVRLAAAPLLGTPRMLLRATVGMYAGWATAAAAQNWASDLGAGIADPQAAPWQTAVLILGALVGVLVTARWGAQLPLYPLTLGWALVGICANGRGSASVLITAIAGLVVVAAAYAWSVHRLHR